MSSGLDIQSVREHYRHLSDNELIHIATQDAVGMTPQAQQVIREEVERRKLDTGLLRAVEAQNQEKYTVEQIDYYCQLIRDLDCPACGSTGIRLNATMAMEVMSFLVFTHHSKKLHVACPACLDKANNNALAKSVILGWWGFPWGIVRTIQAITHNVSNKKTNHLDTPNDILRGFALSSIGQLETYKDDREKLQQVIGG